VTPSNSVNGDGILVAAKHVGHMGGAYVFELQGTTWTETAQLFEAFEIYQSYWD
jgi:hypothetical protein